MKDLFHYDGKKTAELICYFFDNALVEIICAYEFQAYLISKIIRNYTKGVNYVKKQFRKRKQSK